MTYAIKHDYIATLILNESYISREEALEKFLKEDIKRAEREAKEAKKMDEITKNSEEMRGIGATGVAPLYLEGPKIHIQRAEQALENLKNGECVDHIFFWGGGYLMRLISDKNGTKVRIYANQVANPLLETNWESKEEIAKFKDLGFEIKEVIEDNIQPYWFDFNGCFPTTEDEMEEAKEIYGEDNIKEI